MCRTLILWIILGLLAVSLRAQSPNATVNGRDLGAVGDGKADDTVAIQQALDQAAAAGGDVFLPRGTYRITRTLTLARRRAPVIRGGNAMPWRIDPVHTATLLWDGDEGGTLLAVTGVSGLRMTDLVLAGGGRAGVLLQITSVPGWGSMLHKYENVHLMGARTGIRMAAGPGEICNSDMLFDYTSFRDLETAFLVTNHQGVDFLFNYIFALGCGTILDFQCGGNLLVNNAQMTDCRLFLNVGSGGRNTGTYICNNIRMEGGGTTERYQIVKANPSFHQAVIKFTGYDDAQWQWHANQTPTRLIPLCEVGPGACLTFESSIFNGPVATLTGEADAPASLVMRACSFGYVTPADAVKANAFGHFKLLDNFTDKMAPLPDVVKWPQQPAAIIAPDSEHLGAALTSPAE